MRIEAQEQTTTNWVSSYEAVHQGGQMFETRNGSVLLALSNEKDAYPAQDGAYLVLEDNSSRGGKLGRLVGPEFPGGKTVRPVNDRAFMVAAD